MVSQKALSNWGTPDEGMKRGSFAGREKIRPSAALQCWIDFGIAMMVCGFEWVVSSHMEVDAIAYKGVGLVGSPRFV